MRQYEAHGARPTRARSTTRSCSSRTARVTAPISGRVGLRQVDPGNIVHASDTNGIVVITQLQPIERHVHRFPRKRAARDEAAAGRRDAAGRGLGPRAEEKLATGRLLTVDNQIDTATGTVKLKARVPQRRRRALPEPVRQRAHAASRRRRRDARSRRRRSSAARPGTFVYVVKDDGPSRCAGEARRREGETPSSTSGVRRARWSWSTAPTGCAKARRSSSRRATAQARRAAAAAAARKRGEAASRRQRRSGEGGGDERASPPDGHAMNPPASSSCGRSRQRC